MKTRALLVGTITLAVTVVFAGCGSSTRSARDVRVGDPSSTTSPSTAAGPSSLAEFETGVGAVAENEPQPIWFETDAVAALDGTSVFAIHHDTATDTDLLVRIDPATGAVMKQWPLPQTGLSISAVAPKARWIALTDRHPGYGSQDRATTHLVVFDAFTGVIVKQLDLTGDVQPEAFSVDGSLVFALDYRIGYYRVQTIEVATGNRFDTIGRDKTPAEDMHGHAIHGVMSTDRTLLATLYRDPTDAAEPAFVHVLDLVHGWSYCADLHAPFGTGTPGTDTIVLTPDDTVVVAATEAAQLAEMHIDAVHTPRSPVPITYRPGTLPQPSAAFASMPGFEYVIAPVVKR